MKTLTIKKINPVRDKPLNPVRNLRFLNGVNGVNKIPSSLQGILWSVNVKNLDLEKDKVYIIHQVLEYGDLNEIAWLFRMYSKKEVRRVFEKMPMKIYRPQGFNFIKDIILGLKKKQISSEKYVTTLY